jgi:hypothetical protein
MKQYYILHAQIREWYGDENHIGDPSFGRFKNKGGESFFFEGDQFVIWQEDELIAKFNAKYNRADRLMRYEGKTIEPYFAPMQAEIVDGEIVL